MSPQDEPSFRPLRVLMLGAAFVCLVCWLCGFVLMMFAKIIGL